MQLKTLFILIFVLFSHLLFPQNGNKLAFVKGKVLDEDQKALPGASVVLRIAGDSTLQMGDYTNTEGNFILQKIHPGNYLLEVHFVGYSTYSTIFQIDSNRSNYDAGEIILKNVQLDGVEINAQREIISRKPDRTVLNIANSVYSTGENGFSLLRVVPGLNVDSSGEITFRGNQQIVVYVNDRKVNINSKEQLTSYLKSIPSENIRSVEVIPVPGARYDAEGNVAVVNIYTKKQMEFGLMGGVNARYNQNKVTGNNLG
ncbi:carboxypeptidase-like regulatory domain-containing protein, partial [Xanthovirga aplysinae]|uniref:carboxypeptidase-like regulatory domain-containing protein n=1 Tax=Xanthovirga aplysinae TaxID=2529853 RepID=UPI0012BBF07E